jgi:hypothetical protein
VRAAFEARAKGGSWTQVAAILTDGTGKRWSLKATEKLTRNRSYLGELSWGGHTNFDPERAIVDNALFERVQRQRKNGTRHKRRAPGMLTGVAVCAGCGHRMTQDRNARTEFYRCSASHGVCDERANITHRIIEPWVAAQVIDFYLGAFERTDTPDDRTSELEAAIQAAETAFTEVEELRGQISPAAYAKGISAAEEALDTARDALAAYTPEAELPPRAILVRLKETADRDEAEAREELRELIARAVDKVEVHRGRGPVETRVSVYWADGNITGRDEPDILELLMNAKEES